MWFYPEVGENSDYFYPLLGSNISQKDNTDPTAFNVALLIFHRNSIYLNNTYLTKSNGKTVRILNRMWNASDENTGEKRITLESTESLNHALTSTESISPSKHEWIHVALTYSQKQFQLFVNGHSITKTGNCFQNIRLNFLPISYIGRLDNLEYSRIKPFKGKIENLRIWKCARSHRQINEEMYAFISSEQPEISLSYAPLTPNRLLQRAEDLRKLIEGGYSTEHSLSQLYAITKIFYQQSSTYSLQKEVATLKQEKEYYKLKCALLKRKNKELQEEEKSDLKTENIKLRQIINAVNSNPDYFNNSVQETNGFPISLDFAE